MKKILFLLFLSSFSFWVKAVEFRLFYDGTKVQCDLLPTISIDQSLKRNVGEAVLVPFAKEVIIGTAQPFIKKYKTLNNPELEEQTCREIIASKEKFHQTFPLLLKNIESKELQQKLLQIKKEDEEIITMMKAFLENKTQLGKSI